MIKVLMISKALVVGAYHKKLEEMVNLGIHLNIIIPKHWGKYKAEILKGKGYTIHTLPVLLSGKNHFHFYPTLYTYMNNIKSDIIHIDEESFSLVTYLAMRKAKSLGVPAIYFNWQNIFKNYPVPFSSMERYTMNSAAAGIAGSEEAKDVLLKKGCKTEIFVIPQFGVDLSEFKKELNYELRSKIFGDKKIFAVGYVGRLIKEKGINDLLLAIKRFPDDVHIVLIGDGIMRTEIIDKSRELGLLNRVHLLNHVKSTEIPKYLNILDCIVLPSRTYPNWKEQFGRVLVEAMACELPVIGSDSGEIPKVIGDSGIIFPEGNIKALENSIEKLYLNKGLREDFGSKGRLRVEKYFTHKKIAEDIVDVYKKVLSI